MKEMPTWSFTVVNRTRKTKLRYQSSFVPRIGDTIEIGGVYLKVADVVYETAKFSDEGGVFTIYVHVTEIKNTFDLTGCEELEFDEFCERMKEKKTPKVTKIKGSLIARHGLPNL